MAHFTTSHSRRDFLAASMVAAVAASITVKAKPKKTNIPYVDGLCLNVLGKPDDIRASGLTALIADVSDGAPVKLSDGSERYRRTFEACLRSIVATRQKLRGMNDAFLATNSRQIKDAFKSEKTAVFLQIQGAARLSGKTCRALICSMNSACGCCRLLTTIIIHLAAAELKELKVD